MANSRITKKSNRRDRKHLKVGNYWQCSSCFYQSKRYYNLARHEIRIHTPLNRRRECCDMFFSTKGEFYNHCENFHPLLRNNRSWRRKFKMGAGSETPECPKDAESSKKTVSQTNDYTKFARAPYSLRPKARESRNLANNGRGYEESELSENTSESESERSEFFAGNENVNSESTSESEIDVDVDRIEKKTSSPNSTSYKNKISSSLINSSLSDYENDFQANTKNKNSAKESLTKISSSSSSTEKDENILEQNNNCPEQSSPKIFDESKNIPNEQRDFPKPSNLSIRITDSNGLCQNNRSNIDDFNKSINHSNHRILVKSTSSNLPMKKRILRDLLIKNSENIDEPIKPIKPIKPIIDPSYRSENIASKKILPQIRRMLHLGKKKLRSRTDAKKNAPRSYSTASSDVENISPLSGIVREQRALVCEVNVRMDPRVIWEDVTRLHRDYLKAVDFESLKKYR